MTWQRTCAVLLFLLGSLGCGDGGAEPLGPELQALRAAFENLQTQRDSPAEQGLEAALEVVLSTPEGPCPGCEMVVEASRGAGRGVAIVDLAEGDMPLARMQFFHRPELEPGILGGWARDSIGGHAAAVHDEQAVVWAGRVEVRLFSRREGLGGPGLRELASRLPLADLARI